MNRQLFTAALALLVTLVMPVSARAANILLVSDSGDDLGIATALMADGHTVTISPSRFAAGSNPALVVSLTAYDAVYWSQDGTGAGAAVTDAALFTNLTGYVMGGGRVFVTGYDSIASPTDPMLIAFLGGTGSADVVGAPGPVMMIMNSLTTGVVDIRGVTPTGGDSDTDHLTGLMSGTVAVANSAGGGAMWSLRTLGSGEIAYISNGSSSPSWVNTMAGGPGAYNAAIRNFAAAAGLAAGGPCAGADGSACTGGMGAPGTCYGMVCCIGCWDGTRCLGGRTATACGAGGGMCAACSDADLCTTDVCTAGVCSNPDAPMGTSCDDGMFCTATDRCNATGTCVGTGTPCDDMAACTTDSCDEPTRMCMNVPLPTTCIIGGTCVPAGTPNPTNTCQVCDPARSTSGYSGVMVGTSCGTTRCSAGRFDPGGTCNAAGLCEVAPTVDCPAPAMRCATPTLCEGACTPSSCAMGEYCSSTTFMCEPQLAAGSPCSLSSTCLSGFCVDNVCCDAACGGGCERCSSAGRCGLVANGADPDRECAGDDVCDGAGMCRPATMVDAGIDAGMADTGVDAGTDAGMMVMDSGGMMDVSTVDAPVTFPDVPLGIDAGSDPGRRGCACSTARAEAPPLSLLGLALGLGLVLRRRRG